MTVVSRTTTGGGGGGGSPMRMPIDTPSADAPATNSPDAVTAATAASRATDMRLKWPFMTFVLSATRPAAWPDGTVPRRFRMDKDATGRGTFAIRLNRADRAAHRRTLQLR